jgi:hypothetical protein
MGVNHLNYEAVSMAWMGQYMDKSTFEEVASSKHSMPGVTTIEGELENDDMGNVESNQHDEVTPDYPNQSLEPHQPHPQVHEL